MAFEIAHAQEFPLELARVPMPVRDQYRRAFAQLSSAPDAADLPQVTELKGYKDLWYFQVSEDYRLVYHLDAKKRVVRLLMLDHTSRIFQRLGANDQGEPGARIVARSEQLLARQLTPREVGQAEVALAMDAVAAAAPGPEKPLPQTLDPDQLDRWGIPRRYHRFLEYIKTEGALMAISDVPPPVLERVMNCLWPPNIEELSQQPSRLAFDMAAVDAAAEGERSLESFLLLLDDEQKAFLSRFQGRHPSGPWLLKGGPGSGKSTVALYCIRELLAGSFDKLDLLFTTYTNSLVGASGQLLDTLGVKGGQHRLDVKTVDSLAYRYLPEEWKQLQLANPRAYILKTLNQCQSIAGFAFTADDAGFLLEEVDWIIIGQDLASVEEYLQADRSGRGRGLTREQRQQVWDFFQTLCRLLQESNACLFSQRLQVAAKHVTPQYDYLFIDEAQDLKPVAIRFLLGLCRSRANVFLTADTNQSIYGNGISWVKVAEDLRFQGRARILKRNYRTTREVWDGVVQLAPDTDNVDRETLSAATPFRGPVPILAKYSGQREMAERLNSYLHEALRLERVTAASAAVLCPTKRDMEQVVQLLDPGFNAKAMPSKALDLAHPGVKVLTMHAAKGLQFPVVAVVGVEADKLPSPPAKGEDVGEHNARQLRLLFVACSRAMRRLLVFTNRERPSPFLAELSDMCWDIEDL